MVPRDAVIISLAWSLLDRGRWDEALESAARGRRAWFGEVPLALTIEGLVGARRGDPDAARPLEQALDGVAGVPQGSRHAMVRSALAEAAWLRADGDAVREHVQAAAATPWAAEFARPAAELALWSARCGEPVDPPAGAPEPIVRELDGDWRAAIRAWRQLDAPYEAALAALGGDERSAARAMADLRRLGADAGASAFARARAERGARVRRGPRRLTLTNAAGLTRREQEVLDHLSTGETNKEIARALHLSSRTVAHHVSAILSKLDVSTRTAAVAAARRSGALTQDGSRAAPRWTS
jgi:DNA-binding CsgD family transcriptional regulator